MSINALSAYAPAVALPAGTELARRCELLRSLHRRGDPLQLPNAWDAATAGAVVAAGYPVVATTSWGVAATLGYEDDSKAPADDMFWLATRICRAVDVPVSVDAEDGYGMEPAALVAALCEAGAAGCNVEDTNHVEGELRDVDQHAEWLAKLRQAASDLEYPLVINARVDNFLQDYIDQAPPESQRDRVTDAISRANAYLEAGADCVYPITLWEPESLRAFMTDVRGPVNLTRLPEGPSAAEMAALGVARVSWAIFLHLDAMARFSEQIASLT
jgi:2-methylisocitrate lyase-like PEP mutase family enzyme